jgi:hypothetical protein
MATYNITSPDGTKYRINAPDGASENEVMAYAQKSLKPNAPDPTEGNSFIDNALAATGKGMTSVMRAVGVPSKTLEGWGLPGTAEEADKLDAPLMNTAGGKVGNVLGTAAMAAPAALIPGANTYLGATLIGAGAGAAFTDGGLADRAKGALFGAAGGAAGKGLGDALAWGVPKAINAMSSGWLCNSTRRRKPIDAQ